MPLAEDVINTRIGNRIIELFKIPKSKFRGKPWSKKRRRLVTSLHYIVGRQECRRD